jgi:hypothetical protein
MNLRDPKPQAVSQAVMCRQMCPCTSSSNMLLQSLSVCASIHNYWLKIDDGSGNITQHYIGYTIITYENIWALTCTTLITPTFVWPRMYASVGMRAYWEGKYSCISTHACGPVCTATAFIIYGLFLRPASLRRTGEVSEPKSTLVLDWRFQVDKQHFCITNNSAQKFTGILRLLALTGYIEYYCHSVILVTLNINVTQSLLTASVV